MMIADVIRSSNTEHQVYFLLTAYVGTMRYSDKLSRMPEPITHLPLNGISDVRARFGKLMIELDTASKRLDDHSCASIRDAVHVFGISLDRLGLLDAPGCRSNIGVDARAAQTGA